MAITKAPTETNAPPCSSVSPSCRINGASKGKIIEKQAQLARLPAKEKPIQSPEWAFICAQINTKKSLRLN